ncbi:MAG: ribose-phosphate pyrophosphokinase [Inquilinus sp.]|nr:ribose-phosphate pyrophosphokinase [Inquilinus sp.]
MRLFALDAGKPFGTAVAAALGQPLAPHLERAFEDGEHKSRPLVGVRGDDVYVVHSLYGEPGESGNDKLCRLLFFIGALKDAGAARVTAVVPYLAYARKDRRTKPRDPVMTRYLAALFEAVGTDRVVTVDVHNLAAFQNAFRRPTVHLSAVPLLARQVAERLGAAPVTVMSPDIGGVKRAAAFAEALSRATGEPAATGFVEKHRSGGVVSGELMAGEVAGRTVVVVDDMIATGTTILRAAVATHGLFVPPADKVLADPAIDSVVVTNTIPPFRLAGTPAGQSLAIVDLAPLLAEAIGRLHGGGSLVDLAEGEAV